jgi:hypothetical protein
LAAFTGSITSIALTAFSATILTASSPPPTLNTLPVRLEPMPRLQKALL